MQTSRLARLARVVAVLAAALFVGAPALIQLGVLSSLRGFPLFLLGTLLGLVALLLGAVALYTTRPAAGRAGRGAAATAAGVGGLILAVILVTAGPRLAVPPINDITTDFEDPPQFVDLLVVGPNADRDMTYPGEEFARQQREGYPDLGPILVETDPGETFAAVQAAMADFGWEVVREDRRKGVIEATDTSRVFGFVDDIVVRIRPEGDGSRVDMRSKSREGRSDLGANAARIRRLRDALQG